MIIVTDGCGCDVRLISSPRKTISLPSALFKLPFNSWSVLVHFPCWHGHMVACVHVDCMYRFWTLLTECRSFSSIELYYLHNLAQTSFPFWKCWLYCAELDVTSFICQLVGEYDATELHVYYGQWQNRLSILQYQQAILILFCSCFWSAQCGWHCTSLIEQMSETGCAARSWHFPSPFHPYIAAAPPKLHQGDS